VSKLSKLLGKPMEFVIGEVSLELKPLKMSDLPLMMSMSSTDPAKQADAMKKVISKTLKEAVPDVTEEELDGLAVNHFQALTEAIMMVNGLNDKLQKQNRKPAE